MGPVELLVMVAGKKRLVVCDGPWLVVQLRKHCITSFKRNWTDYKNGFGSLQTDLWLGLEAMHQITTKQPHKVRFEMTANNGTAYVAEYSRFKIGSETTNYRLDIAGYTGNAGDEISSPLSVRLKINGYPFSTPDRDNDVWSNNCAKVANAGFWYKVCTAVRINSPCAGQPGYDYDGRRLSYMGWLSRDVTPALNYSRMTIMPNP